MQLRAVLTALAAFTQSVVAAPTIVGSWTIGGDDDSQWAASKNDSGGAFGKWCVSRDNGCYWMYAGDTVCVADTQTPILINAAIGAISVLGTCRGPVGSAGPNLYKWVLAQPDDIDKLVFGSSQVGLALPVGDTVFKVARFNVGQASAAFEVLHIRASVAAARFSSSTKDTNL